MIGDTIGPKRMRRVRVATAESDVHVSSDGRRDSPPSPVRWSERHSDSKPSDSAARPAGPALPGEALLSLDHDADAHAALLRLDSLPRPGPAWSAMCADRVPSKRLLLLIPTSTYRTEDFVEAARRLDVDLVVASERDERARGRVPRPPPALPFDDPGAAAKRRVASTRARGRSTRSCRSTTSRRSPGAAIAAALGLRANPVAAVAATRDKRVMRERSPRAGVPRAGTSPSFALDRPIRTRPRARVRLSVRAEAARALGEPRRHPRRRRGASSSPRSAASPRSSPSPTCASSAPGARAHPRRGLRAGRRGRARGPARPRRARARSRCSTSPTRSTGPSSRRRSTSRRRACRQTTQARRRRGRRPTPRARSACATGPSTPSSACNAGAARVR